MRTHELYPPSGQHDIVRTSEQYPPSGQHDNVRTREQYPPLDQHECHDTLNSTLPVANMTVS